MHESRCLGFQFSLNTLNDNVSRMMRNYNTEISRYVNEKPAYPISEFINMDATRISWTAILRNRAKKGFIFPDKISYECDRIACYRPFVKSNLYLINTLMRTSVYRHIYFQMHKQQIKLLLYLG